MKNVYAAVGNELLHILTCGREKKKSDDLMLHKYDWFKESFE